MKLIDLNILLYAVNEDADVGVVKKWWSDAINSGERLGLAWVAILGFLRISTNPRSMKIPLKPSVAIETIQTWLNLENVRIVYEAEDHWDTLQDLIEEVGTAGDLVTDAHVAALAISHGATLVSCDNDFSRFKGLRWENPLA